MRLIVTRALADGRRTAAALTELGHEPILAPLIDIRLNAGPPLVLDEVSALVATSAYGVRALAHRTDRRDLPLFVVGPHSRTLAHRAGFIEVHSAGGNAEALLPQIRQARPARDTVLFHAAGKHTNDALLRTLVAEGYRLRSQALYEAHAIAHLPHAAVRALAAGTADGVLLYSRRSAEIFATRVTAAGLAGACAALTAYCLSAATAEGLGTLPRAQLRIAIRPDQDGMMALL